MLAGARQRILVDLVLLGREAILLFLSLQGFLQDLLDLLQLLLAQPALFALVVIEFPLLVEALSQSSFSCWSWI